MKFNLRSLSVAPMLHSMNGEKADFRGYAFGAIGAILFSMKAIFIKLAYRPGVVESAAQVDVLTLLALRMIFSLPFYIIVWVWARRQWMSHHDTPPTLSLYIKAAFLGILGYYICAYLDFAGLQYITAQLERLLLFTYPIFVLLLGAMFFGGRIRPSAIGSIIIAYCGIGLIFAGGDIASGDHLVLGSVLVLAAAFLFALFQLLAKGQINILGSTLFTCVAMIAASLVALAHFVSVNVVESGLIEALNWPMRIYVLGFMIALVSTIIPSFLVNIALGRVGAQTVAMLGMLSPITTIIFAVWLLGEPFGFIDGVGTILTIFGIGLYTWFETKSHIAESSDKPLAR